MSAKGGFGMSHKDQRVLLQKLGFVGDAEKDSFAAKLKQKGEDQLVSKI